MVANVSDGGRSTRWLRRHRIGIVLSVAVLEGILAWATHGLHLWTIVVLGLIALASILLFNFTRQRTTSPFLHQILWLVAASQLGATVVVAAGYIILPALVIIVVIFALIALGLLLLERG